MERSAKKDRFLIQRRGRFVYQRRVPARYAHVDERRYVKFALRTDSIDIARERRDALARADDDYWAMLAAEAAEKGNLTKSAREVARRRCESASRRAMAFGFSYQTADGLAENATITELIERIRLLEGQVKNKDDAPSQAASEALPGGLDCGLRCTLMGHKNDRPAYGNGGSLEYRRDELLKIEHPYPDGLVRPAGERLAKAS